MSEVPSDNQFPPSFICPITDEVMRDPVIDPEGNSYERSAIEDWLSRNSTSPVTRSPLKPSDLAPNRALREAIEGRYAELGIELPAAPPSPSPSPDSSSSSSSSPSPPSDCDGVRLETTLVVDSKRANSVLLHASVVPPEGVERTPQDVCCVVDISYSMSSEAKVRNERGDMESHGLSLLDVVKHAVKTVAHTLGPRDRLSVVAFGSSASVLLRLTAMDDAGKKEVERKLDALRPNGQTNLWDGLHNGLEVLREGASSDRVASILLLTDGQPNVEPPRGHIPMLRRYRDQHRELSCSVNTFGFGYNLDSQLLHDLALEGDGMYSFIPDSAMVGTCFVNAAANLMTTIGWNTTVMVEVEGGVKVSEPSDVLGSMPSELTSWGAQIRAGSLQMGQSKDFVVRLDVPEGVSPCASVTVKWGGAGGEHRLTSEVQRVEPWESAGATDAKGQYYRLVATNAILAAMKQRNDAVALIAQVAAEIAASKTPNCAELAKDLTGQVTEALSRVDWYKKWGVHYLPSLVFAHLRQQCNNFKDPGVQAYGGRLFEEVRDAADAIFCKLPPPTPSVTRPSPSYYSSGASSSSSSSSSSHGGTASLFGSAPTFKPRKSNISMKSYHCRSNPCFSGPSPVVMADGSTKPVQLVRKGDAVRTGALDRDGRPVTAEVACVLKTQCEHAQEWLVALPDAPGVQCTPFHPVQSKGRWVFPEQLAAPQLVACEAVYSFVLRESIGNAAKEVAQGKTGGEAPVSMSIGGVRCITLGHGVEGDAVASHEFFGTERVLKELQGMRGWERGFVEMRHGSVVRCDHSKRVKGLNRDREVFCE